MAVWNPSPIWKLASLETIRELMSIVAAKGYGRDLLYRDLESHYVLIRSLEVRRRHVGAALRKT